MDDYEISQLEQSITAAVDTYPRLWAGLYNGCVNEGLSRELAAEFVRAYIAAPGGDCDEV